MNKSSIDMIVALLPLEQKVKKLAGHQFRCPACHDSQKNSTKKRGWIYYKNSRFVCYNCGLRMSFKSFLRQYFPMAYKDYLKSLGFKTIVKSQKQKEEELIKKINPLDKLDLTPVLSLDHNHIAYKYIQERQIPLKYKKQLYYTDNFQKFIHDKFDKFEKEKIPYQDKRIVIPHFNKFNKIICLQARDLNPYSKCRYLTILLDETHPNIGGIESIDKTKTIYITEGYFDHTFIPNSLCINSADVDLSVLTTIADKDKFVFVYDNEPRNRQIIKRMKKVVKQGFKIVIWPETKGKDINEMILNGMEIKDICDIIKNNTFSGLVALNKICGRLRR